ncbi:MAG: hypothetical protein KDA28_08960, partial [Phycisphaerales bacterium]|nr:hypothetical protein [Phycisphaerales bacterium]
AYIDRWAFKSPQPSDFFRTMDDVAGEDLGWFWRGWFQEPWTMDQAVVGVDHADNTVTIRNVGDLVMPTVVEITHRDGRTSRVELPVETWFLTDEWTFEVDGEIRGVRLDPDQAFPDIDDSNDTWPR